MSTPTTNAKTTRSLTPKPTLQSRTSTPHNVPNAALVGASLAFAKPAPKPTHLVKSYTGSNGALSAAKSVNFQPPPTPPRTLSNASRISLNSDSLDGYFANDKRDSVLTFESPRAISTVSKSNIAAQPAFSVKPSYSLRAATLAAANSTPKPSRQETPSIPIVVTPPDTRLVPINGTAVRRTTPSLAEENMENRIRERPTLDRSGTDTSSILAAKSLVKMFEQQSTGNDGSRPAVGRKPSLAKGKPPPIISPKPTRAIPIHSVSPELRRSDMGPLPKPAPKPLPKRTSPPGDEAVGRMAKSGNSGSTSLSASTTATPQAARQIPGPRNGSSSSMYRNSIADNNIIQQQKPDLPPPRRTARQRSTSKDPTKSPSPLRRQPTITTLSEFGSTSPHRRSTHTDFLTPPQQPPKRQLSPSTAFQIREDLPFNPNRPSPAPYHERNLQKISPHMSGDSLANAMVGANLALRKNSSPGPRSATPPPPPPPRRKEHHHISNHLHRSRSLSPTKRGDGGMMQTLREEVEEKNKKLSKHKYRPKPNKHHEGTRERWRDEITEEELKRYEGVWAANKGLYIDTDPFVRIEESTKDEVQNIVVRELWERSRLPPEKLATVWDLVISGQDTGRLNREQFVVGMWLIDQNLKGRNLAHQISQSVWNSVKLRGVQVKIEGKGLDGRKLERGVPF